MNWQNGNNKKSVNTNHIKNNPACSFAGIYVDEALSGKNAAKRAEFMRMVTDGENKKFDLIEKYIGNMLLQKTITQPLLLVKILRKPES